MNGMDFLYFRTKFGVPRPLHCVIAAKKGVCFFVHQALD